MPFDARTHAAETQDDCPSFPFVGMDGEPYELPHPGSLDTDLAVRFAEAQSDGNEVEVWRLLADLAPAAVDAIRKMPVRTSMALLEQWQGELGEAGKSPGASSAPNRAERRSQRTSPSGA